MATPVADSIPLVAANGASLTDEFINGLVQGSSWRTGPDIGSPVSHVLTYSLNINDNGDIPPGDENFPQPGPGGNWTDPANVPMANAVAAALAAWSSVADITFQPVASGTYYFQSTADLAITLTGDDLQTGFGAIGLAFFPDPDYADSVLAGEPIDAVWAKPEGDVFLDNYYDAFDYLNPGGTGLTVILHELGHALGLKHPGDDGGNGRPLFTDPAMAIGAYDSMQYTVMSSGIAAYASSATGFAATPMPLDILAIQQIYGANLIYNAGDDNYVLANDGVLKTIWDAGGTDTFDASGLSFAVTLNLNEGAYSWHWTLAGPMGNISTAVAYNVTIENAIGGSGNDTITGNAAANTLDGGAGADSMSGGGGNDTYILDQAGDAVTEGAGAGTDTVVSPFTYGLDQPGRQDIENVTLTGTADINANGNTAGNVLTGNSGANVLHGYNGVDTLIGGPGNDTYIVWETGDVVTENSDEGADTVQASATHALSVNVEDLVLDASAGAINGTGNAAGNVIAGNASANVLDGGGGADTLTGGAGNDGYVVDDSGDLVTENPGPDSDRVQSFITYALGPNVEDLTLAGGGDIDGTGNSLGNRLVGNDGNNVLDGGGGADALSGAGGDDVYVVDHPGDTVTEMPLSTVLASTASDGTQGNSGSSYGVVSDDGQVAAFQSFAINFAPGGIGTGQHIFVKDLQTGATTRATSAADGTPANNSSSLPNLSADGRYVAFESFADNLVADDTNGTYDIFVKDLQTGAVTRASTAADGTQGDASSSGAPEISGDGRYVVFQSTAGNLVPGDLGMVDIFVKDLLTGTTTLVSTSSDGAPGNSHSQYPVLSADGRYVVFRSSATNLVAGDANGASDLFRKDLQTGATDFVSSASDGTQSNADATLGGVSGDGRYVAFNSAATNLVAGDTNGWIDVFVKDLVTGAMVRASTASGGAEANSGSNGCAISADGRYVLFDSIATNLAPGDTDAGFDVFVKDLQTGLTALISAPATGVKMGSLSIGYSLSGDGRYVVFESFASNLVAGDTNGQGDVFVSQNPLADPGGIDEARTGVDFTLGADLERLVLTGTGGISGAGNNLDNLITGNAGANALNGGGGADTLDGGAGVDTLAGGAGDDTHLVRVTATVASAGIAFVADVVTEAAAEGTDIVYSNSSFALAPGVEDLVLTGAPLWRAYVGTGNELDNRLAGEGAARHRLFGEAGNDTLVGGAGRDTLDGGPGNDVIEGGDGDDRIVWDAADAAINGGAGADTLAVAGAGVLLDLTALPDEAIQDVETVDLTGTGDNTLTLNLSDVLAISLSTDTLRIEGDAGDSVSAGAGWSGGGEALGYRTWTQGTATLVIDAEVLQNLVS